jgi:hypothetical protein
MRVSSQPNLKSDLMLEALVSHIVSTGNIFHNKMFGILWTVWPLSGPWKKHVIIVQYIYWKWNRLLLLTTCQPQRVNFTFLKSVNKEDLFICPSIFHNALSITGYNAGLTPFWYKTKFWQVFYLYKTCILFKEILIKLVNISQKKIHFILTGGLGRKIKRPNSIPYS